MFTASKQKVAVMVTAALAALVVTFLVGLAVGRRTAAQPVGKTQPTAGMHSEASARAVAFYKAYYRGQDYGAAWDMASPGIFGNKYKTREQFIEERSWRSPSRPDVPFEISEYKRVDDFVYLISDADAQWLIWVTLRTGEWKVSRFMAYDGGEIEW